MDQAWDRAQGPWPSRASVRVRELSWQSRHNPRPRSKAPGSRGGSRSELLVEEHLSPARLQALAQVDDLRLVSVLELCVNTHENSLGNFGLHLPNLSQLKLNGSCLGSLSWGLSRPPSAQRDEQRSTAAADQPDLRPHVKHSSILIA
ncbi:hypothetical protein J1605_002303 [Eschrichtius robustus]|uniref:Leucine-rich repeat-containing protein 56 n=1 Tax=Eschrichtius robustus TaxID=9764 RepID=A0AB34HV42_ESCRO|nr:hypothetical protein J1605_002303 [Eschrichtius robustus]